MEGDEDRAVTQRRLVAVDCRLVLARPPQQSGDLLARILAPGDERIAVLVASGNELSSCLDDVVHSPSERSTVSIGRPHGIRQSYASVGHPTHESRAVSRPVSLGVTLKRERVD